MKFILKAALLATAALGLPASAVAQSDSGKVDWTGPYIGGSLGYSWQPSDNGETIGFDTNRDGNFGDTVRVANGNNAFTPGFCGGAAYTSLPSGGCKRDKDGTTWAVHAGYDRQFGNIVAGVVIEGGKTLITDSVSAFSTTPANYVMTRKLDWNASARARLGFTTDGGTMIYATGGGAYGKVKNSFTTTNVANGFTQTRIKDNAWGWVAGGGVEQKISNNFSVGVLYKYTRFDADGYRVTAGQGAVPSVTNPFVNPAFTSGSTDFARDSKFDNHSVAATASFRF